MTAYWCRRAWLGPDAGVRERVSVTVAAGAITGVTPDAEPDPEAVWLEGLVVPGFANCHSHVFHRALRARTQHGAGDFWTWRDQMYAVATRLDPDTFHRLARATYVEMATAGISTVGEFHYLHHDAEGRPYADANEMGHAAIAAARQAGLRITLLDTCYLQAGFGRDVEGVQRRFSDGDVERWAVRAGELAAAYEGADDIVVGAAIHSVRAVPEGQLGTVAAWAGERGGPLHAHVSEQPAENVDCVAATGLTPTALLDRHGVLGPLTSAVHATHLTTDDVAALGEAQAFACLCPTTERDLADGVGPAHRLDAAGARLTLGSDSHAVIDMSEEMRAVETDERLMSLRRGTWSAEQLLSAATATGQASLGFAGGSLAVGAPADLVGLRTDSLRTAGTGGGAETVVFAATSADVNDVVIAGRHVVADGRHVRLPDAARDLDAVTAELLERS